MPAPMGMLDWILPQDRRFYDLLDRQIALALDAVHQFRSALTNWDRLETERQKMKELENLADGVAHEMFERLNQTFITPIDREDLARLAHAIDDVVDALYGATNRLVLYEIDAPTATMREFTDTVEEQVKHLQASIQALRRLRQIATSIPPHNQEVHRLENSADRLLNRTVAELFKTHDPVQILKYKEIYEFLESATDRCEDVADVLADVVRKHT